MLYQYPESSVLSHYSHNAMKTPILDKGTRVPVLLLAWWDFGKPDGPSVFTDIRVGRALAHAAGAGGLDRLDGRLMS